MKTIAPLLLVATALAVDCPKNCEEWEGVCACDAPKATVPETDYSSDEKPPCHPQPEWERGIVNTVTVPNLAAEDAKMDREKAEADAEGKRAAGIE